MHPSVLEGFDLKFQVVALFELKLPALLQLVAAADRQVKSLARYPAATRDLALLVPADVPQGRVEEIIAGHRLVERAELFDVYTGDNVPAGTKSLAFHVYFQSHQRTLTAEEVDRSLEGLLRNLERQVSAKLRS